MCAAAQFRSVFIYLTVFVLNREMITRITLFVANRAVGSMCVHVDIATPLAYEGKAVTTVISKTGNRILYRLSVRIFGPKRGEITGGWRRLHNEELHNLYA
jgi:hypothetical protein